MHTTLLVYILAAMVAWFPPARHPEPDDVTAVRYANIARDIVEVVMDPAEPPLFQEPGGRVRTALLAASIAAQESGFRAYVDDGSCNQKGFLPGRRPHCDHGRAYSPWQIQTGRGMSLIGDGWGWWSIRSPEARILGQDLLADRKLACRLSLHISRRSLRDFGSLCAYTGEACRGEHPKADARLDPVERWFKTHPFSEGREAQASTTPS